MTTAGPGKLANQESITTTTSSCAEGSTNTGSNGLCTLISSATTSTNSSIVNIQSSPASTTTSSSAHSGKTTMITTIELVPTDLIAGAYLCSSESNIIIYCTTKDSVAIPVSTVTGTSTLVQTTETLSSARPPYIAGISAVTTAPFGVSSASTAPGSTTSLSSNPSRTATGTAATASSSNATSTPRASTSQSKSNTGALAGAAAGCFVAGLLLAGLIALCILRKRKNERYGHPANYAPAPAHPYGEKGTPMVAIAPVVTDFLPEQADDAEVRHRISTVIDQIDQHVENFYINQPTELTPAMEGELSRFETSQLPYPLAACFERTSHPTVLIKHCLAFHTFNLTMGPGEGTTPILPPEMANMIGLTYSRSISPQVSRDFITAFATWKRLTSYLRPDLLKDPNSLNKSTEASTRIANHFTDIFTPWRNDAYTDDQRARHLTELLDHAVHTAIWLFGQPDNYRFEWVAPSADMTRTGSVSVRGRASEKVVVAPGVSKVTHDGARLPGTGQQVIPAVTKRM